MGCVSEFAQMFFVPGRLFFLSLIACLTPLSSPFFRCSGCLSDDAMVSDADVIALASPPHVQAQKPWAKLLEKLTKAKSDYHTSCKNERSAINQERNATGDTSLSPDQVKKLQERVIKCKEEVSRNREKYEAALKELTDYNQKYQDDMTEVFEKCQEFEEKRLNFFKETLLGIHACLDISSDPTLSQIYRDFRQVIEAADSAKDLKWWSQNHGTGMPPNWPVFEEYTPDLHNISKKERKIVNQMINHDSVTLTHVNHHPVHVNKFSDSNHVNSAADNNHKNSHQIHVHSHFHSNAIVSSMNNGRSGSNGTHSSTSSNHSGSSSHGKSLHISENHPHHHQSVVTSSSAAAAATASAPKRYAASGTTTGLNGGSGYSAPHPADSRTPSTSAGGNGGGPASAGSRQQTALSEGGYEDEHEDWDDYPKDALIDTGEQGVPVKALYDYEGAESDELSFKQGEEFEKLEDEDEQGWCKGRKDGRVGLYPANYVEPIPLPLPVK